MNNNQQQGNRLQLNFGFGGGGDRNNQYAQEQGRAFPTTPSTFPQPVYPNQAGQQEVWGAQQQQPQVGGNGYGGYFQSPYQQAQYQGQQGNLQAPGSARFDQSPNGLAQQLSQQHLGVAATALEARMAASLRRTSSDPAPLTTEDLATVAMEAALRPDSRRNHCMTKKHQSGTLRSTQATSPSRQPCLRA